MLQNDKYADAWRKINIYRITYCILPLSLIAFVIYTYLELRPEFPRVAIAAIFLTVILLVVDYLIKSNILCPRCGKNFLNAFKNERTNACVHCGLEIGSGPEVR
jgi:ribosomal protein S27AE